MELINQSGCEVWRGILALRSLGASTPDDEAALQGHLDGCGQCRALALELEKTVHLLAYANPELVVAADAIPPSLTERVLTDLRHAGVRRRRLTTAALAAAGFAAAAVIATVVLTSGTVGSPREQRTVVLHGTAPVSATVILSARSWGTSIVLHERGLPGGGAYTVSMESDSGHWWVAGSYRAVSGHSLEVTMACSVALQHITGIRVANGVGATVLSSYRVWT